MTRVKRVTIVLAKWCPHCILLSLDYAKRVADVFKVPLRVLDMDVDREERTADLLIEKYGFYVDDYTIPQNILSMIKQKSNTS